MHIRRVFLWTILSYAAISCILGVILAELAFHPLRTPVSSETTARDMAEKYGAKLQDITLISGDFVRLQGWFAKPSNTNGDAVILFHGVGDNRTGMLGFASVFLSKGYAVLLPDSRGHGSSGGIPSYGVKEADDVVRWYKWLSSHGNTHCIFGMGESMGGAILLQASSRIPFCAVVAESPFASFRQIAYIRVGQFLNRGSWVGKTILRPSVESAFLYGWLTRGIWLPDASPEKSVAKSRVPVLLIHGMADFSIPFQQSERILARNQAAVNLWKVPNAGHCGASALAGREFYDRVIGWFALHESSHSCPALN